MFQQRKLSIVLALLLTVILTLTGCSNSVVNKAADNAKAFADQKNFERAAQTLHSAEKELGSNLGPKELKALTNAYSYIIIKIADNAKAEAEKGNFEEAFAKLGSGNEIINLPPGMSLSKEAVDTTQSAKKDIIQKCLKKVLDSKGVEDYQVSIKLFNAVSKNIQEPVTPELQKMFDDARIRITELPVPSITKNLNSGNWAASEESIKYLENNLDKSISSAQSDKFTEARELSLKAKTKADIDLRLAQAEQYFVSRSGIFSDVVVTTKYISATIDKIYNDPIYRKALTEDQKQRYNTLSMWVRERIKKEMPNSDETKLRTWYGISSNPIPPIQ